eukprot:c17951_g1_i1 orf=410-1930(+)
MKDSIGRTEIERSFFYGTSTPSKGMKRLVLVIFVMTCSFILALGWLSGRDGILFCVDRQVTLFHEGFFSRSVEHNKEQTTKLPVMRSSKNPVDNGDALTPVEYNKEQAANVPSLKSSKNPVENGDALKSVEYNKKQAGELPVWKPSKNHVENGDALKSVCDYSRGRWVKDDNGPLYSGKECKLWLSSMWACKLMDRPDFNYENYRWQPDGCDLPVFDGLTFLSRMQNKVLAFVGDSIGRQQYQSLMCLITAGKEELAVKDVSLEYGFFKPRGALRADGTAQRFSLTNTTIIYHWSASLCEIKPLKRKDSETEYALHLDRPAAFLQKYIHKLDVLVLNTRHHWNRGKFKSNKWIVHVNGKPGMVGSRNDVNAAYYFAVHRVLAWLHKQLEGNHTAALIYMRSLSPRHFFNGEWDSGGRCDGSRSPIERKNVTGWMTRDEVVESAITGTRVRLLNVTLLSQFRDDAHISKYRSKEGWQDCLHWCLPGVPDVWNEVLYADLFYGQQKII